MLKLSMIKIDYKKLEVSFIFALFFEEKFKKFDNCFK